MNWEAIGAFGEIVGALAVVCSLIFVGRQFREGSKQTTQMMWLQVVDRFSSSTENAAVISRGHKDPKSLSEEEVLQYISVMFELLNVVDIMWEQSRRNLVSDQGMVRVLSACAWHLTMPGGQAFLRGGLGTPPIIEPGQESWTPLENGFIKWPKELLLELERRSRMIMVTE